MPLDLWQHNADTAVADAARRSAPDFPATFDETFSSAVNYGQTFVSSVNASNARLSALDDKLSEIKRTTGVDLFSELDPEYPDFGELNAAIRARKAKDPSFPVDEISEDEINKSALNVSQSAAADYAAMQRREKTFGGKVGMFLGGAGSAAADPVNILALPVVAPEGLPILASMGIWGAIGAGTQAIGEAVGAPYREQVQPGYIESGQPVSNIIESGLFAAGTAGLIHGAAAVWERVATGQWPRSVRDAGNTVASENHTQRTNVFPGVEGDAVHRESLATAIDDVLAGRAVDVESIFARSRAIVARLETESGMSLPIFDRRAIDLLSADARLADRDSLLQSQLEGLPEGQAGAAERLTRVQEVERQIGGATGQQRLELSRRRDELLADTTPERLEMQARPLELRRAAENERSSIAAQRKAIADELAQKQADRLVPDQPLIGQRMVVRSSTLFEAHEARIEAVMNEARAAARGVEQAKAERAAAAGERAPELPFKPVAAEAKAEQHAATVANEVQRLSSQAGYQMPREEAQRVAGMVVNAKSDDHARAILMEVSARPQTIADHPPTAPARATEELPVPQRQITPEETVKTLQSSDHQAALQSDIDRARMTGDRKIPVAIDENGEPVFRSVDEAMNEVESYKTAAEQIQACVNPPKEEGEAA